MQNPAPRRTNRRLALLIATGDERQVDRTLMAARAVRHGHPDAAVAVVTDRPSHRLWRCGLFDIVVSSADEPDANVADCCRMAMDRGIFERAMMLDSHCRLRAEDVGPAFAALERAELAAPVGGDGLAYGLLMVRRSKAARALLQGWSDRIRSGAAPAEALDALMRKAAASDMAAALPGHWQPRAAAGPDDTPLVEVRRGDVSRLHAEMLNFALHRLLSGDLRRAAAIYARVALAAQPDLPQLGPERLVPHLAAGFRSRLPHLEGQNLDQLDELLRHAAVEDPAGNLLSIAALHLEMGQVKTAIAVLRMVYRMRFSKPAPLPS